MRFSLPVPGDTRAFAHRHRFAILAIVMIDSIMATLDGSMVTIALPSISAGYGATLSDTQWVLTAYLIAMTCLFIFFGRMSERTGTAILFTIGSIIFTASSLACGLVGDLHQLVLFRITQGIGSSMIAGIGTVILFRVFPPNELGRVLGYSGSVVSFCGFVGPGLGGFISDTIGWQAIFFVNVPIGIFLFLCNIRYLRVPDPVATGRNTDWIGAATLCVSCATLMLMFGDLAAHGAVTTAAALYGTVFLLSLAGFLARELSCADPLLDLSIFRNSRYVLLIVCALLCTVASFMISTLVPFYLEGALSLSAFQAGLILMVNPVVMVAASGATGWIIDRYRWKYFAGTGLAVSAVATFFLGYAFFALNLIVILAMLVLWGIGMLAFNMQNRIDILKSLPYEKAAVATSLSTTTRTFGASLGVMAGSTLLTLLLGSWYGYTGPVLAAGPANLADAAGIVVIAGGVLFVVAAFLSLYRSSGSGIVSGHE
ncbi:MAG: MFS transporter [Methanoregula sp.]|jgi:EmrB/QacA subfamily drug resistance transporter